MKCLYRISSNSYKKDKLPHATKKHCLVNFLIQFDQADVIVYADHLDDETKQILETYRDTTGLDLRFIDGGSSAQSFRIVYEEAINGQFPDDEVVYLVEDDYLHCDYSQKILLEGMERAHYITLYTCPDKFYVPGITKYLNPVVAQEGRGGENTTVLRTPSSYWMLTNSTTLTFASTVKQLKEDYETWKAYCFATPEQTHPNDFQCFLKLREQGRSLLMPLPTLSTHVEKDWLAYDIDWERV